jgi:hypothetical protein
MFFRLKNETLSKLFLENKIKVADKWELYLEVYNQKFSKYKNLDLRLLEIGIQNGGSLEIWSSYFKNAKLILGVDTNPLCSNLVYKKSKIEVLVGDANTSNTYSKVIERCSEFEIIIDDGSHNSIEIIGSFVKYFSLLADDGLYVIEDLHASYWSEFQGGLYEKTSAVNFFKLLIDSLNFDFWGNGVSMKDHLMSFEELITNDFLETTIKQIHSIEFINSLCLITKRNSGTVLGPRVISGHEAIVDDGPLSKIGETISIPNQN